MIIIAAYHLMLYFNNKEEKDNLIFALLNIFSALYLCVFFYDNLPLDFGEKVSFLIFQKIFSNSMPFFLAYMITSFISHFVHAKEYKAIKIN